MSNFRRVGLAGAIAGALVTVPAMAQAADGDLLHRGADADTKTWHVTYKGAKAVTLTAKGSASASYYAAGYLEGDLCSHPGFAQGQWHPTLPDERGRARSAGGVGSAPRTTRRRARPTLAS